MPKFQLFMKNLAQGLSQSTDLSVIGYFDNFPHQVLICNADNRIVYANPAFLKRYGYTKKALIGLPPKVLWSESQSAANFKAMMETVFERYQHWQGPVVNLTATGEAYHIHLFVLPLRPLTNERPIGYMGVSCDIGEEQAVTFDLIASLTTHLLGSMKEENFRLLPFKQKERGDRQREIMRLTNLGFSTKEIAHMMGISPSTVGVVKWKQRKRLKVQSEIAAAS